VLGFSTFCHRLSALDKGDWSFTTLSSLSFIIAVFVAGQSASDGARKHSGARGALTLFQNSVSHSPLFTSHFPSTMLYLQPLNQPVLTSASPKAMSCQSQTKDNPMKDKARQEPSSNRSRRTALCQSTTPTRRFLAPSEKRSKIGQKSVYFGECDFFNYSASTYYNLDPLKRTDFRLRPARNPNLTPNPSWLGGGPASPRLPLSLSSLCALAFLRLCVEFQPPSGGRQGQVKAILYICRAKTE
jgi:hypothetical protein